MHLKNAAFITHAVVETAAGVSFIARPEAQLPACTPAAKLILRQYGALLLASSVVCLIVVTDSKLDSTTMRLLAATLGSYHVWPAYRSSSRLRDRTRRSMNETQVLGGPMVHLVVHIACFSLFLYVAIIEG